MTRNQIAVISLCLLISASAIAQQRTVRHPGAEPHVPTRIDWLTTVLQASLRVEMTEQNGYLLQIANPDTETILIYVRYLPSVNREVMNMNIDSARKVIQITAKSYGWDSWVRVREDIQMGTPRR